MSSKLKKYIAGIPIEITRAISGFDNDIRLSIFLALMKHRELSFSELSRKLGMEEDKAKLNFHLRKLTESALIEHRYHHQLGNEKFSFYSTTEFGENLWDSIVSSLRPTPPSTKMEESSGKYVIGLKELPSFGKFIVSDNIMIPIASTTESHKQKMPKIFSDQVNYEEAVVQAGT
jgi:hypothetical protein